MMIHGNERAPPESDAPSDALYRILWLIAEYRSYPHARYPEFIMDAAAAVAQLMGGSPSQIEYAAEMGLEHHLGLTCDPVCGMVQIPCIERNAYAAARAMDASIYSLYTDGRHRVSFDQVVRVMKETGKDLPSLYKETSEGGLAKHLE